jgi:DNA-binding CsgD family transcriptional regulator
MRLRLALALTALLARDLDEARGQAADARADARTLGAPAFELAALAATALASASAADEDAVRRIEESAAALERLSGAELATRLPAFWMHGRARRQLGSLDASLDDLRRGAALAEQTGRERILLILTLESVATLIELGRLAEAVAAAEEGLERARLAGNPRMLLWAQSALSSALLASGDVAEALRQAELAARQETSADFHMAGQPGWCLGTALAAAGNADRAVPVLLDAFGGPDLSGLVPADRPAAACDLVEALLMVGDVAGARAVAGSGEARAAVLLALERPEEAAAAAREISADLPLAAARARLLEGRALAAAGDRRAAVQALTEAEAALHGFGARRRRDEAVRELRRLGHRVVRRVEDEGGLTAREREIAGLVAAGRTNREIAVQLVLSPRTIEAHLRNIYGKLDVRSRVELARELQR